MVRAAEKARTVAELANRLWPDHALEELEAEFGQLIEDPDAAVFLAYQGEQAVGFAQCQLRHDYVEGTGSSPVGYLEGIFVDETVRHRGYARLLLGACEIWTKEKGCVEFASDCELENEESLRFHLKTGFEEVGRIICFVKRIGE